MALFDMFITTPFFLEAYLLFSRIGNETDEELKEDFQQFCRALDADRSDVSKAQKLYQEFLVSHEDSAEEILAYWKGSGSEDQRNLEHFSPFVNFNKEGQWQLIWAMIHLLYTHMTCTDRERDILEFLINEWELDEAVFLTMIDTAETIRVMLDQSAWIETTDRTERERKDVVECLHKDVQKQEQSIQLLIQEIA